MLWTVNYHMHYSNSKRPSSQCPEQWNICTMCISQFQGGQEVDTLSSELSYALHNLKSTKQSMPKTVNYHVHYTISKQSNSQCHAQWITMCINQFQSSQAVAALKSELSCALYKWKKIPSSQCLNSLLSCELHNFKMAKQSMLWTVKNHMNYWNSKRPSSQCPERWTKQSMHWTVNYHMHCTI